MLRGRKGNKSASILPLYIKEEEGLKGNKSYGKYKWLTILSLSIICIIIIMALFSVKKHSIILLDDNPCNIFPWLTLGVHPSVISLYCPLSSVTVSKSILNIMDENQGTNVFKVREDIMKLSSEIDISSTFTCGVYRERTFYDDVTGLIAVYFNTNVEQIEIPLLSVNDNYCDCPDGSDEPGTNACTMNQGSIDSRFHCKQLALKTTVERKKYVQKEPSRPETRNFIPASQIGDGIMDCCDGSDEIYYSSDIYRQSTCS